jgi:DnaJ domain
MPAPRRSRKHTIKLVFLDMLISATSLIGDPQLAKQFHPDTNKDKGAHERFVEIQAAYDVSFSVGASNCPLA